MSQIVPPSIYVSVNSSTNHPSVSAGVLGLTCALELARKDQNVTIIAQDLPGDSTIDYASPWAGAHFRPSPAQTPAEQLEQELMRETYRQLQTIAEQHPEAGVQFIPAIEYFDSADLTSFLAKENGYIDWPGFRTLAPQEYPVGHPAIQLGVTYRSWVLNSPVYLQWLKRRATRRGVRFIRARVSSVEDALAVIRPDPSVSRTEERVLAVVDASGRGLNDPSSFPSRGQFVVVSNSCDRTISHHWADGSSTVIIPRPLGGGTVIGGTKEPNNWYVELINEYVCCPRGVRQRLTFQGPRMSRMPTQRSFSKERQRSAPAWSTRIFMRRPRFTDFTFARYTWHVVL